MEMLRFDNRVAVVTGAGRGIGRAYTMLLAARGCQVVVNNIGEKSADAADGEDPATKVVREIESLGGVAVADSHDVVTEAADIIDTAIASFGRLDIVINNAGVLDPADFVDMPSERWHAAADVHLKGTVEVCRAAWPYVKQSDSARILNTTSTGMIGVSGVTSYTAAKGAIFSFTRSLALEWRPHGINVNAIMPSAWTRMTSGFSNKAMRDVMEHHLQPDYVAAFVAWLVHPSVDIWNEVFRVSGHGAARMLMTTAPTTFVEEVSPESWASVGQGLLREDGLVALHTGFDCFSRELREADPSIDLSGSGESIVVGK